MLARARSTFEGWHNLDRPPAELVRDALSQLSSPFAHDSKCKKEGGPKMFFLASPWQMLNAIPRAVSLRDASIRAISNVTWPGKPSFKDEWLANGQPVTTYPTSCTYMERSDGTLPADTKHEYFMTVDIDGINALSKEQEQGDKTVRDALCTQVVDMFMKSRDDAEPAILSCLTSILVEAFRRMCGASVAVSWHKTFGYKPSWRAYIVGIAFRDNYEAKAFVDEEVKDRCLQMFRERLPEPLRSSGRLDKIVDCGTYADGWDRCLGSAKLNSTNPQQMRFHRVQPLADLTDPSLLRLFNECPNKYLLTVLGWIYPEAVFDGSRARSSFIWASDVTAGTRSSSGKRLAGPLSLAPCGKVPRLGPDGHQASLDTAQNARLSSLIAQSFARHKFAHPDDTTKLWAGDGGVLKNKGTKQESFEIYAAPSDFMLCVYRNCGFRKSDTPTAIVAPFDHKSSMHSPENSAGKIMYRVSLGHDRQTWIRQNCHKCGGEFGYKMHFICPLDPAPAGESIKSYVLGPSVVKEKTLVVADSMETEPVEPDDDLNSYYIANVTVVVCGLRRQLHI